MLRVFRSAGHEARYRAAYEATLALWPVEHEAYTVETPAGQTHVIDSGPRDGAPVVLLPWGGTSSTVWYRGIAGLSRDHRTLALDIMCDAGRSVPGRLFRSEGDYVQWLVEVLDALGVQRVHVVGGSYGGFLALVFALGAPQRVGKVALLAPAAGLVKLGPRFWLRMLGPGLLPLRSVLASFHRGLAAEPLDQVFVEQGIESRRCVRYLLRVAPRVLTDEELGQLCAPVLLLVGSREFIYSDPAAALQRCRERVREGRAELIPDAGHLLVMDRPEEVSSRIVDFFAD